MSDIALGIQHLYKKYRKGGTVAVEDLTLSIPKGEFFGLLGPNGAGKSTTIHCITGISQPTAGTISIFGKDAVRDYKEARSLVGLSPQEFNTDIFETPRQIVDYMGGYHGLPSAVRRTRVDELMERFSLTAHADKKFQMLSGGLKRRVMLARALVHDPELLILDEPTAGIDVELRRTMWEMLTQLNKEGKTIILTSHYLEEVERLCDRVAIMAAGRIVIEGPKHDFLKEAGGLESAYLKATQVQSQ